MAIKCAEVLERTHAELGFLRGHCGIALELGCESIKRSLLRTVAYSMWTVAYEACASRLWHLILALRFSLTAPIARQLFLPLIFAVVAFVLATLSLTFALVGLFVLGLGRVFGERFRNGDGVVKCLNATPIKLGLGPILEAILKVEERILVGHVAYLQHEGSELIDVVPNATRLLEAT